MVKEGLVGAATVSGAATRRITVDEVVVDEGTSGTGVVGREVVLQLGMGSGGVNEVASAAAYAMASAADDPATLPAERSLVVRGVAPVDARGESSWVGGAASGLVALAVAGCALHASDSPGFEVPLSGFFGLDLGGGRCRASFTVPRFCDAIFALTFGKGLDVVVS